MTDFCSSILIPEHVYRNLTKAMPNVSEWVKDGSISMFTEWLLAVERAEVFAYNEVTKEQKFVFAFEKCAIPGSCFPDEVAKKRLNEDEAYSFLAFNFPVFQSPENHETTIQAEILIRMNIVEINGEPFLDYWIEPSLNDELNTWLDERPDEALYKYATVLLGAFYYIQMRMLRDKERIVRFQTREIDRNIRETEAAEKNPTPHKIKIGCIQYMYLPVEDPEKATRSYNRHAEAWNVRGHYRTYKSGKRVFIRPYTKGKGRITQVEYVV